MKKLPEVNVSFEDLYRMLIGPIKSKLLLTGIEQKVFNHLSEPRSAEVVAEAIGAHTVNTRLLLDCLAASDLVVKINAVAYPKRREAASWGVWKRMGRLLQEGN